VIYGSQNFSNDIKNFLPTTTKLEVDTSNTTTTTNTSTRNHNDSISNDSGYFSPFLPSPSTIDTSLTPKSIADYTYFDEPCIPERLHASNIPFKFTETDLRIHFQVKK
jgi:hypothetical protein